MSGEADKESALSNALGAAENAPAVLAAFRSFLGSPAYASNVDLAVLTSLAADKSVPAQARLRAAEILLRYRIKAMEALASLECVREQVLRELGIESAPQVALTQVNQRIEIVRADDWRAAQPLEQGATVEVLPEPSAPEALNGHDKTADPEEA